MTAEAGHGPYPAIWLRREEDHLVVLVEVGDDWHEVIREYDAGPGESQTSHIVEPAKVSKIVNGEGGDA